jgi:lipopolysaccharide transport system permease protein
VATLTPAVAPAPTELRISAHDSDKIDWKELWQFRELFYFLAWRDVKIRYQQTVVGAAWAVLQPLIMMLVFTAVVHRMAGVASGTVPYALFAYTGLVFWQFFAAALNAASNSLVSSQGIVTKIYFPRLLVPLAAILALLVDFVAASSILAVLFVVFRHAPGLLGIALFVPALLVVAMTAAGLGLLLASMNVKFRDVRHALPFLIQVGFFATPVIYPPSLLPPSVQWVAWINPISAPILAVRAALLREGDVPWAQTGIATLIAVALLVLGLRYFKKRERYFVDVI